MPTKQATRVAGIVAEYNPFHSGHAWMVRALRERGFGGVVCVMSGPFVQRAEPALYPTALRAAAAVAGGVDLVLRLPLPWAARSAEGFAAGGVGLLAALGCVDTLAFGAEAADTGALRRVAGALLGEAFPPLLRRELASGASFAAARAAAAEALLPGAAALLGRPNNILGVEYCKALAGLAAEGEAPEALALPRQGAAHDGPPKEGYASASHLRLLAAGQGAGALAPFVPAECLALYRGAEERGEAISAARWELAALARLRGLPAGAFAALPGAGEGLEARVARAAQQATSLEELYRLAKTKRFAHSRVRRLVLSAVLGLPAKAPAAPPFLQVLAANEAGLALLGRAAATARLPLGTSLAKLSRESAAAGQTAALEAAAEDLHALCRLKPAPGGAAYTQPVQLL